MQMAKTSRGEYLDEYILGLFRKTNRKIVYSLIFQLFKETKSQNKIYLNSKKKRKKKFILIKP